MPSLLLSLLAIAVLRASTVAAQGTNATCSSDFAWMDNSKGQSPCLVASYLFLPCSAPADSWVYPLTPTFHYNTPLDDPQSATPCRCNTVLYSMIEACATCQGQGLYVTPWSTYSQNCTFNDEPFLQSYPENIPSGTAVPAWAYLDVVLDGTFNATAAQQKANEDAPDSVAPSTAASTTAASTSATTGGATTTQASGSPTSGADSNNNSGSSSSKTNIGAIVGGVVGGVVVLLLLGGAIIFFLRRRRNNSAPSQMVDINAGAPYTQYATYNNPYPQYTGEKSPESAVPLASAPEPSPRLYNPNDPSTFPSSGGYNTSHHSGPIAPSYHTSGDQPSFQQTNTSSRMQYNGIPEL